MAVLLSHHEAGLIARCWEAGGRELPAALRQAAGWPADVPPGLWLLSVEDPRVTPALGRRTAA